MDHRVIREWRGRLALITGDPRGASSSAEADVWQLSACSHRRSENGVRSAISAGHSRSTPISGPFRCLWTSLKGATSGAEHPQQGVLIEAPLARSFMRPAV